MVFPRIRPGFIAPLIRVLCLAVIVYPAPTSIARGAEDIPRDVLEGRARIERPLPDAKGGQAYRLIYVVDVPVEIYWRFKTDFDNNFVVTHRSITFHRVVEKIDNVVITENKYRSHGDRVFRWKTTIQDASHRLEYLLLNPRSVEHRFHHGYIQVRPINGRTLVIQTAYFSFFGESLWANLPVLGGMRSSLRYTASWERETVERLKDNYTSPYRDLPKSDATIHVSE